MFIKVKSLELENAQYHWSSEKCELEGGILDQDVWKAEKRNFLVMYNRTIRFLYPFIIFTTLPPLSVSLLSSFSPNASSPHPFHQFRSFSFRALIYITKCINMYSKCKSSLTTFANSKHILFKELNTEVSHCYEHICHIHVKLFSSQFEKLLLNALSFNQTWVITR